MSVGGCVGCVRARERRGGGAGDKAETRRETAGLHVRRAKSQSASGKAWERACVFLGRPQMSSRTATLGTTRVCGRSA